MHVKCQLSVLHCSCYQRGHTALARKLENVWDKAKYVARPNVPKQADRVKVEAMLDKLLEVTKCSHKILLCSETGSGCLGEKDCKLKAHINCDCPLESKVPVASNGVEVVCSSKSKDR